MISLRQVLALDDLPALSDAATIALLGLVLVAWLALRVQILRRRDASRAPGKQPVPAARWLERLAAWRWTWPVLALLAAGFVWLLVYGSGG